MLESGFCITKDPTHDVFGTQDNPQILGHMIDSKFFENTISTL